MSNLNVYSADKVVKDHLARFWLARGVRVVSYDSTQALTKAQAKAERKAQEKLQRELKLLQEQHEAAIEAVIAEKAAQEKAATNAEHIRVQSEQAKKKSSEARAAREAMEAASKAYWAEKAAARKAREASRIDRLIAKAELKAQAKEANALFIAKRRDEKAAARQALLTAACVRLNEVPVKGGTLEGKILNLPMAFWVNSSTTITTNSSSNAAGGSL